MKLPNVAIIIITYFTMTDTEVCITSVLKTRYPNFRLYIVDNGSLPGEWEKLKKRFRSSRITYIHNSKNLGFAGANNNILSRITEPYAVLLNNDTIVEPGWLMPMIKLMEKTPTLAAMQPKIRSYFNRSYFEYAGGAGGLIDHFGYPFVRGRVGFELEEDVGQYDDEMLIHWASGTAMLLRTKAFKKIGPFAESFFMYQEEIDWCWRAMIAGWNLMYCPSSVIYHKGAQSAKRNMFRRTYLVHRNNLHMVIRNSPSSVLLWLLPLRMVLDGLTMGYYIILGRFSFAASVVWAYIQMVKILPNVQKSGTEQQRNRVYKTLQPYSLYFEYFIRKRKRYWELPGNVPFRGRVSKLTEYRIY